MLLHGVVNGLRFAECRVVHFRVNAQLDAMQYKTMRGSNRVVAGQIVPTQIDAIDASSRRIFGTNASQHVIFNLPSGIVFHVARLFDLKDVCISDPDVRVTLL